ncbi:MAG TPA: hypothetical protein VK879_16755 [Candidatus Sulfomarinibacteraceae bacterium]|nr:hypothetical protein [Candidatus Sulfomarinibacteraceae bacterium]
MKPLVFWCRWHEASLRLHGRSESAVWGELAFEDHTEPFHFDLHNWTLTIDPDGEKRVLQLDEMGVEVAG